MLKRAKPKSLGELLPVSKAKNADELLNDIVKITRQEPKRVNMFNYVGYRGHASLSRFPRFYRDGMYIEPDIPACGAIGCIAGWGAILTRHNRKRLPRNGQADAIMRRILGAKPGLNEYNYEIDGLFSPLGHDISNLRPGTREYAEVVIARIRRFQRKHRALLRTCKIRRK